MVITRLQAAELDYIGHEVVVSLNSPTKLIVEITLLCRCICLVRPYDDEEDMYQCAEVYVDITDSWIDRKQVMDFGGMTEETFNPIWFAIYCVEYYGAENFGAAGCWMCKYDWTHMTKEKVKDVLKIFEDEKCTCVVHDCEVFETNTGEIIYNSFFDFRN